MQVLWRIAIKEEKKERGLTIFSNKFGDDLESEESIVQRFEEIRDMNVNI